MPFAIDAARRVAKSPSPAAAVEAILVRRPLPLPPPPDDVEDMPTPGADDRCVTTQRPRVSGVEAATTRIAYPRCPPSRWGKCREPLLLACALMLAFSVAALIMVLFAG